MTGNLNIVHASSLARINDDGGPRRGPAQDRLDLIADGAVAIRGGRVVAVGATEQVLRAAGDDAPTIDASGKTVLPGLVECHCHPMFSGRRSWEYDRRLRGTSSAAIRAEGGGIWASVLRTRAASDRELLDNAAAAYRDILSGGAATLEVKSGYGLTLDQELRLLRLLKVSAASTPMDLVYTFLGAHIAPREGQPPAEYARVVREAMIPAVLEQGIAELHDLSCENGDFSASEARELLAASREKGFRTRVHADASSPSGGWRTAAEGGAISADHLTYTSEKEIASVGPADTVAVLLPLAEQFYLDEKRAPARKFIETGVPVAIATDYCSSFQATSLTLSIAVACSWFRLTPAEAVVGATLNAAYALGKGTDRGSLDVGKRGDVTIFGCEHPDDIAVRIGAPLVDAVVSMGREIYSKNGTLTV